MTNLSRLKLAGILLVTAGCSAGSNQLGGLTTLINEGIEPSTSSADAFFWVADINESNEADVLAIAVSDHTAFANRDGWIIRFDGWEIFEVQVPELAISIKKQSTDDQEILESLDGIQAYECGLWVELAVDEGSYFEKRCSVDGQERVNYIKVNAQGVTTEVLQHMGAQLNPIRLSKSM
jgi:hypothetical protein